MPFDDKVSRPRTLVLFVPEQLRAGSREEFVEKLLAAFSSHEVLAVQFVPGFHVRLTFAREQSRHDVFRDGLSVDGVDIQLREADPTTRYVYLHHCPYEVPDSVIKDALAEYGTVLSVQECYHKGTEILNGSRVIKMNVTTAIPSKLYVLRYPCRVWYRNQPEQCHNCDSYGHRADKCPLRDVCRKCRQPGHFARNCRNPLGPVRADPPSDPPVSTPSPDAVPSEDNQPDAELSDADDDGSSSDSMETDELASGDEEVLRNAPPLSNSPRRTRSSTAVLRTTLPDSVDEQPSVSDNVPAAVDDLPPASADDPTTVILDVESDPDTIPVSPASFPPSGIAASDVPPEIQSAFESNCSRHALLIKEGNVFSVIDMNR